MLCIVKVKNLLPHLTLVKLLTFYQWPLLINAFNKCSICQVCIIIRILLVAVQPQLFMGEGLKYINLNPMVCLTYCGLCKADSHLASFTAPQPLVTSSWACSALPRTSVCKRLEGRKQPPRPDRGVGRKAFVRNSRKGERQVGHNCSYSSSPSLCQPYQRGSCCTLDMFAS